MARYVKFMRGTPSAYAALVTKENDTLYFISNPGDSEVSLYLGSKLISGNGIAGPGSAGDLSELLGLNDLSDVIVNTLDLADASFLIYNQAQNAWVNVNRDALAFAGSTSLSNGKAGLVPAPTSEDVNKFLRADGSWATIPASEAISSTAVYEIIPNEEEDKETALARVLNGTELHQGDIAIVKVLIANDKYEHTAYVFNDHKWVAMDGNYSADNVYFKSDFVFTENVGTVVIPESGNIEVPAAGMNVTEFFNSLFSKVKEPEITQPTASISYDNVKTYYEVGETVTPKYTTTFTSGSYEFGPSDTGVTVSSYTISDTNGNSATTASGTLPSFVVKDDTKYNITATIAYTDGVKANNNLNKESNSYIESGSITKVTSYVRGYRAAFAGMDSTNEAITSDLIRGLDVAWNYNGSKTITLDASTADVTPTRFIVAIPANSTRTGISKVEMPKSQYANCTSDYKLQETNVLVKGANNADAIEYKVWIYAPAKIGAEEVHEITMN